MTAPSYASAAAATIAQNQAHRRQQKQHEMLQSLVDPPPKSMQLTSTLFLLEGLIRPRDYVYLMTTSYLENWLGWAYHVDTPAEEEARLRKAIRTVTDALGLEMPADDSSEYDDPGPIDASPLSLPGEPLLLRPCVSLLTPKETALNVPIALMKNLSITEVQNDPVDSDPTSSEETFTCCAVPERFYEVLRSVHGVVCEDGTSLSFQPLLPSVAIHHHHHVSSIDEKSFIPRPVAFRRRVLRVSVSPKQRPMSPVTKLMQQAQGFQPQLFEVELYPLKLNYIIAGDGDSTLHQNGQNEFLLVSRATLVADAMNALVKAATPTKARSCVRIWCKTSTLRQGSKTVHAVQTGDGYELVQLENLDGKLMNDDSDGNKESTLTMEQWAERMAGKDGLHSLDILIETRASVKASWSRESLELGNRLQVGDFVDAQDATGSWYEAIIRSVSEDTVKVHYSGWASKWDGTVRRRPGEEDIECTRKNVNSPAPLWSHTTRWRENIRVGNAVEIREAASVASRPKWYRGVIRKISGETEESREIVGGAELEMLEVDETQPNGKKRPLLLLNRTRQVLVEVAQENLGAFRPPQFLQQGSSKDLVDQPPYIRWVNLYGEEICASGTHLKPEQTNGPATINYEFDTSRPPVEIMKSFNNMHGTGFVRESLRGVPPAPGSVGLHNLGNSCFLNSIVQCLNHIGPLTQFFLKGTYARDLNRTNPLGSSGRVASAYASLLYQIWGGKYSILAPRTLKQTVASFAPQFNNLYQHDSHEFCSFLMDGIHEDLNRVKSKPYVEELEGFGMEDEKAAIESWRKHLLRHDSIIVDRFQGMHRSHVTCPLCGRESIKFDVYSSISLPVQQEKKDQSTIPLSDCLEKFMEGEQLDDRNAWYCPGCKKHVCALKMIALWSVPDILILHLKRFTFSNHDGKVVRNKIEDKVDFPVERLDMSPYILGPVDKDAPPVYNLIGVSEHTGSTANSGHYLATVRNSKDGKWYRYNDSHVGMTSGDASVTGGAYMLFYQRKKGSSRWAGLEKAMNERSVDPHGGLDTDQDGFKQVKSKKKKKGKH